MHDELITALRTCVDKDKDCPECPYYDRCMHTSGKHAAMVDAADAIEELTATAESYKRSMEAWADEAARAQPRWIPVTETKKPKAYEPVMVVYIGWNDAKPHRDCTAYWSEDEGLWRWAETNDKVKVSVTHYMPLPPLPEPPKEEEANV